MTSKVKILQSLRRLFIILVGLTMTWCSEKMLLSNTCRRGLIKKSVTVSITYVCIIIGACLLAKFDNMQCLNKLRRLVHSKTTSILRDQTSFCHELTQIVHGQTLYFDICLHQPALPDFEFRLGNNRQRFFKIFSRFQKNSSGNYFRQLRRSRPHLLARRGTKIGEDWRFFHFFVFRDFFND